MNNSVNLTTRLSLSPEKEAGFAKHMKKWTGDPDNVPTGVVFRIFYEITAPRTILQVNPLEDQETQLPTNQLIIKPGTPLSNMMLESRRRKKRQSLAQKLNLDEQLGQKLVNAGFKTVRSLKGQDHRQIMRQGFNPTQAKKIMESLSSAGLA